ncbi:DUF2145 domain-containing protein [Massilia sp. S19_KUP03_FR1]|uniref:DUF2145 domain-containing protein n=1 Tax=Massilia sp. S19_KUP03_FR1 TaxID=3025503 RepID=UPI002FCD75F7
MRPLLAVFVLAASLVGGAAHAGNACAETKPQARDFIDGMALAQRTRAALEQTDAQVVLIARAGQDLSKYGMRYSHMAFAWRDHPKGRWFVVHELNECGTAASTLYNEGLGNFFLGGMFSYEARIVVPSPAVQQRLAAMLASNTPLRMHSPRYNMLAYPFATTYQNSNQWLLESWAAAMSEFPIADRTQAQAWLKLANYQPITLRIPTMTRLGGRMFRANIAFDDQPFDRRMAGQIDAVTVESVVRFVHQVDHGSSDIDIK